jgi:CO/xanthine dehydrogenase Mo-binding subunit
MTESGGGCRATPAVTRILTGIDVRACMTVEVVDEKASLAERRLGASRNVIALAVVIHDTSREQDWRRGTGFACELEHCSPRYSRGVGGTSFSTVS